MEIETVKAGEWIDEFYYSFLPYVHLNTKLLHINLELCTDFFDYTLIVHFPFESIKSEIAAKNVQTKSMESKTEERIHTIWTN